MSNIAFRPVRGTEASIKALPRTDGYVYYAVDSGRIYMDKGNERIMMGGSGSGSGTANGSSIYFGTYGEKIVPDDAGLYSYPIDKLEDVKPGAEPRVNDIILDKGGALYRITEILDNEYKCILLPLSGSGGRDEIQPSVEIISTTGDVVVNGQDFILKCKVCSYIKNDKPITDKLQLYVTLTDTSTNQVYQTLNYGYENGLRHDEEFKINLGPNLNASTTTEIKMYATGLNHETQSYLVTASVRTVEMYLQKASSYDPAFRYSRDNTVLKCNAYGALDKILVCTFDGKEICRQALGAGSLAENNIPVPQNYATHGYHSVNITLYQNVGTPERPVEGVAAPSLEYEIAVVEAGNTTPIIWLGDYKDTYFHYDTIEIPILAYDPANTDQVNLYLFKNDIPINEKLEDSKITISGSEKLKEYYYWQIADADLDKRSYYSIECYSNETKKARREIRFTVTIDPIRTIALSKQDYLKLNFDPAGRSNAESLARRSSWSYEKDGVTKKASFDNFNWYNNGWFYDSKEKNTFLRISNGASLTIPYENLIFGSNSTGQESHSIELAFKVRNIQNHSNLVTNITRYKIPTEFNPDGTVKTYIDDDNYYTRFTEQEQYTNYDAFLQVELSKLGANIYDNLQFVRVQKNIDLKYAIFGLYSGDNTSATGVCVGPQDAFFSNGDATVSVNFVENEMVYLSFVYDNNLKLLFIYINGVITGVIKTDGDSFTINSNSIVFNSNSCDIDLYKIRIYDESLNVQNVLMNHATDKKSPIIYDQLALAEENESLKEFQLKFNKILEYNDKDEYKNKPLMPYIIFDTSTLTSDDKLPYTKQNDPIKVKVDFVNSPLDVAFRTGDLVKKAVEDGLLDEYESNEDIVNEAVATYYKHHCPSWTSTLTAKDYVTLEVQGTSSEFYPRRNFKIKTKYEMDDESNFCVWGELEDDDGEPTGEFGWTEDSCLNLYMNKGPFEKIYNEDKEKLKADEHYYGSEKCRLSDGWYMNNYTNSTDRWTMKVDYMESSGSYNAGFASLVGTAYTKHPLQDYIKSDINALNKPEELKSSIFNEYRWGDYRTSLLGFPVMAFQKRKKLGSSSGETEYLFIGYYRMLLDKGSDKVLGFKPSKKITHKFVNNKPVRDIAECWEFANNARTFCSYKDPWNRVELSFKAPADLGTDGLIQLEGGVIGGPLVLKHFEPRYFKYKDYFANDEDGFYNFGALKQSTINDMCKDIGIDPIEKTSSDAYFKAQDAAVNLMSNWEKVCKWIYSTNLDNVKSQGHYPKAAVGITEYKPNEFFIFDEETSEYIKSTEEYNKDLTYYEYYEWEEERTEIDENGEEITVTETKSGYRNAYAVHKDYIYKPNKFYIKLQGEFVICLDAEFDSSATYYELKTFEDESLIDADLLVSPATEYNANTEYYTYDSQAKVTGGKTSAVTHVGKVSKDLYDKNNYYVASPVQYGESTYKYDTKEYRTAKFVNEIEDHFDLEYLATYFVMTEVFECYDSRGKNCMMASWGPQKEGGDYVWYPIFYDIDTQLGINNTGIPSFEFNVDATEAKNYSTSDSILWNNFYKFFKGSEILNKYKNLRGLGSTYTQLEQPPLKDVDTLEKWYSQDPDITHNIANKGTRPLIATNLDMYFKYITITNKAAIGQGVAYIPGVDGKYAIDGDGKYFYALQGDRSQSRRQFLTNRLEYIDSWLNQGNYSRGGSNLIRGRISANSEVEGTTSDWWVQTNEDPYWADKEFGTKTHEFDAEYWLTLTPIRSTYVTAGDDSANYPSQKYDGIHPVNFALTDLKSGIMSSRNYPEQLVYIYGTNQMSDFGNMNNLYWTEFVMEGEANNLTRLQLGYDGLDKDGKRWYNQKLNGISLVDMPLLKEANFSNIGLLTETRLRLGASEKLESFRAVGTSKLNQVEFAEGVALNTLYLPASISTLKLVQANLLTTLIDEANAPKPTRNENGTVTPPTQGLFIEGFFPEDIKNFSSSLNNIHFEGGSLGLGSYRILKQFHDVIAGRPSSNKLNKITMKDVNWSPFTQLTEGAEYDETLPYYYDDRHYGLKTWTPVAADFNNLVNNGRLYLFNGEPEDSFKVKDDFITILNDLRVETTYADSSSSKKNPIISGVVYVYNTNSVEESFIRDDLQEKYPDLKFFFKTVDPAYSAEFLFKNPETGKDEYVKFKDGIVRPSVQKISQKDYTDGKKVWFDSPFDLYKPERTHYEFVGWSTNPNTKPEDVTITGDSAWVNLSITSGKMEYIYYAIFRKHFYNVTFYDGKGDVDTTFTVEYGDTVPESKIPAIMPEKDGGPEQDLYLTNSFIGYSDDDSNNKVVDPTSIEIIGETKFWPVFEEVDVYKNIHPEYFSGVLESDNSVTLSLRKKVQGKLTIPKEFEIDGKLYPVGKIDATFAPTRGAWTNMTPNGGGLTHVFFEKGTQIKTFGTEAFYCANKSNAKLKYIEFPDTLQTIEKGCFTRCATLDYSVAKTADKLPTAVIRGKNISSIGEEAFQQAFVEIGLDTFQIGSSVRSLGNNCFYNTGYAQSKAKITTIVIGTPEEPSKLQLDKNQTKVLSGAKKIIIYSDIYTDDDEGTILAATTDCNEVDVI